MKNVGALVAGAVLVAASMAACSTGGNATSGAATSPLTRASATTTTTTNGDVSTTTSTTSAPSPVSQRLGALLVTPASFSPSTSTDVTNGPLDAATFDTDVGTPGSAATLGFVGGYDETYDQDNGDDSVEVVLFQFGSPTEAMSALSIFELGEKGNMGVTSGFGAIRGAVSVMFAQASDGTYQHDVLAVKNTRLMVISYTAATVRPAANVSSIAVNQYRTL